MAPRKTKRSPNGDSNNLAESSEALFELNSVSVDTFNGNIEVEWDKNASTTPFGQLPFFIEFLKIGNLFEPWVDDCPLHLTSPNAPSKRDILGTVLLSVLAGHTRYAHVTAIRNDGINPELLGMTKIVSEDSLRRSLAKIDETEGVSWLQEHLKRCYVPLLTTAWVLDVDTTVKTLFGNQEGAEVGYNPHKPGRPSHSYHTYSIANLRLILDVDVEPGNHSTANYTTPGLWKIIDNLPFESRPSFIRGDCGFGNDNVMRGAELRDLPYLFKLRQSKNVKNLIEQLSRGHDYWEDAGQGWRGVESHIRLDGWDIERRVIVIRRKIRSNVVIVNQNLISKNNELSFGEIIPHGDIYEYAVLITSLSGEVSSIAQLYRDRADCENTFDEMKNQWGWGGFTTQDLHRCRLMARTIALVYNWWNIFVRLAQPEKHLEAISSRPLLMHGVAKQTMHAGKSKIKVSSQHGKSGMIQLFLGRITSFFNELKSIAEQLTKQEIWFRILSKAVEKYLNGNPLKPTTCLT